MLRLYHDEDSIDGALVAALRRVGFDCATAAEVNLLGVPDEVQLEFARGEDRVLFTRNTRDFQRLNTQWLSTGRTHAGIIALTDYHLPIGAQVRGIQNVAVKFTAEAMVNRFLYLLNHV